MANYTLATEKVRLGAMSNGLKAGSIRAGGGATLATARINPGAGQVKFMPANIPQAVEDQTSAGVQHFMGTMSEAAFKYDERESTYYSKQAINRYQSFATDLENGTVDAQGNVTKGYTHLKGQAALDGYKDHVAALDTAYNTALEQLEPRVRQKAMIDMTTVYNSAKSNAAKHNIEQFQLQEEDEKFRTLQGYQDRMLNFGDSILKVDASGITLLDKIAGEFDTTEEAIEWVGNALKENVQSAYLTNYDRVRQETGSSDIAATQAFNAARDYATKYAQPILNGTLNTDASNDVLSYLNRVENQALQAKANMARANEGVVEAAFDARVRKQENALRQREVDVKSGAVDDNGVPIGIPNRQEILDMAPDLGGSRYDHWVAAFHKRTTDKGDPFIASKWINTATNTPLTEEQWATARKSPSLTDTDLDVMKNRQAELANSSRAIDVAEVSSHLDDLFDLGAINSMLSKKFGDAEGNSIRTEAEATKSRCMLSTASKEQCSLELDLQYDMREDTISYHGLDPLLQGSADTAVQVKPKTREQLIPLKDTLLAKSTFFKQKADNFLAANPGMPLPPNLDIERATLLREEALMTNWFNLFDKKDAYTELYGQPLNFRDSTFTRSKVTQ